MTPRRRFTVADGMILIAGSAVGLGLLRVHSADYEKWLFYRSPVHVYPAWMYHLPDRHQFAGAIPLLVAWSLAVLALQLTKPRLPLRRLAQRRGFASCLAVAVGIALWLVVDGGIKIRDAFQTGSPVSDFIVFENEMPKLVGTSIGAAWLLLAIGGRWRLREPDWRGRLGRLLGWAWLFVFVLLDFGLGLLRG